MEAGRVQRYSHALLPRGPLGWGGPAGDRGWGRGKRSSSLFRMWKASEGGMLWGCPGLPHVLAPEAYPALPRPLWSGPAQGRKPGYRHPCCTPAPCPPRAPPLVSTPPQLCKSDPTLSRVLGAAGPLVRCPQGSSEAWPHPPVLTSLLDLVAHSVQPRILTAWAGCCVGTPQVVLMPWTPTPSTRLTTASFV